MIAREENQTGIARPAARVADAGFTLIEMMVVLSIFGLVASIGVKGFLSVAKSDLREATAHMSGAIRYMFDRASVTGKYHRLVIDLNDGQYWAEVSDDKFYAPNQAETAGQLRKRENADAEADEEKRKLADKQRSLWASAS